MLSIARLLWPLLLNATMIIWWLQLRSDTSKNWCSLAHAAAADVTVVDAETDCHWPVITRSTSSSIREQLHQWPRQSVDYTRASRMKTDFSTSRTRHRRRLAADDVDDVLDADIWLSTARGTAGADVLSRNMTWRHVVSHDVTWHDVMSCLIHVLACRLLLYLNNVLSASIRVIFIGSLRAKGPRFWVSEFEII